MDPSSNQSGLSVWTVQARLSLTSDDEDAEVDEIKERNGYSGSDDQGGRGMWERKAISNCKFRIAN